MSDQKLRRELSLLTMIALGSGSVIGGWLAEAPYWFSLTGAGAAWIFPALGILLIPVGLAFAELTALLPFASSIDVWTTNALGHKAGWAAQWMMFLVQVVEPPMMAFIFLTAINFFVPVPPHLMKVFAIVIVFLWYLLSNFRIGFTGTLANIFFYSMVIMSLFVAFMFFRSSTWSFANVSGSGGWFPLGGRGIFVAMAVFSLKFIGFELTPTLAEEMNFPIRNIWKVVMGSLFIPAILYCIVVLAIGGMAPWSSIAGMTMPEPEIVRNVGLPVFISVIAIISGLLHALTTLMGFWTSSARVIYGAAQLNQLPKQLMKLNKHGQPYICNLVVLLFGIFFCLFTGDNWVQYIYAVSCIAAGLVYGIVCIDAIILRNRHPEWERPFVAPGGNTLFGIGIITSAWIIVGSVLELPLGGYIALAIYLVIGVAISAIMDSLRKNNREEYELITLTPDDVERMA